MNISNASDWTETEVSQYLKSSIIPVRIATARVPFPTLCSIWYLFDETRGELLCASHENSQLVKDLMTNDKCAFEIATNDPPYCGVRGRAIVTLTRENVESTLTELIERYLGDTNSRLASWLLGRIEQEYILTLKPQWLTSWDYSQRMGE
jgi:hypothetical protein